MNIVNKLTIRSLKENKRRTLVTIFGVIISVAMITAVATLAVSFLDLMKRDAITRNGEWHVQYNDVNIEQLAAIEEDSNTKNVILSNDRGYAYLPSSTNSNKPYLFIKEYNQNGLEEFPIELKEGRFPQSHHEVIISEDILKNSEENYQIGDTMTLDIGERDAEELDSDSNLTQYNSLLRNEEGVYESLKLHTTETFEIVGLMERPSWEPSWSPGYTVIRYIDKSLLNTQDETVNAVISVHKVKKDIFDHAEQLAEENKIESFSFNSELLRYEGVTASDNLRKTMYSLTSIIMSVIIVGSVALIYNAFAISVSERSRHLGMLSSVGATKKQKRNSVFFEGAVIGAISIPLGIFSGLLGIGITFAFLNSIISGVFNTTDKLELVVTPATILVSCGVSILTIFISTYWPARRASKISAIDAIRQTQDVKLSKKAVKTSRLVRKVFGLEAEIGLKNIKRNRKRYMITIFSLVVSIVLFLSVSYFTDNLKKTVEFSQDGTSYDIHVYGGSTTVISDEFKPLTEIDNVTDTTIKREIGFQALVDPRHLPPGLAERVEEDESNLTDGKYRYWINLHGIDEKSFASYGEKVGLDVEKLNESSSPQAIVIDQIVYEDYDARKFVEAKSIHASIGDTIELIATDYETGEGGLPVGQVEIAALTNELPMGVMSYGLGSLDMVVSHDTFAQIVQGVDIETQQNMMQTDLFLTSSDPIATEEAINEVKSDSMYVYNVYKNKQEEEQMILFISVFTYGFIVLISLISIANIFNTISTGMALRKREFAMLRSVGMTPKGFNKLVRYESLFYGIKALTYGLPISFAVMVLIHYSLRYTFEYGFSIPWMSVLFVIIAIFVIVGSAMLYSIQKIKKENIVDGLKQENT